MKNGKNQCCEKINVLVIAPRFPAINQPWIDTYLEHLLVEGINPKVLTQNAKSTVYSEKVDRLGLRDYILPFSTAVSARLRSLVFQALHLRSFARALRVAYEISSDSKSFFLHLLMAMHVLRNRHLFAACNIIHSHAETPAYLLLSLSRLLDIPLMTTFHGLPPTGVGQLSAIKRKKLYDRCVSVLVNTAFAKEQVCSLGCDAKKVSIIPQGLPLDDFPLLYQSAPSSFAEDLRLLTVGRFHRDKGQIYALLALRRLLDSGRHVTWTFVGVGPDRVRLEKWVEKLKLSQSVVFMEGVSAKKLSELYRTNHLFVLTSIASVTGHVETQGVVLQEAQASGCIPIASRVGGIPECIHDKKDALIVKQKSSREIYSAIEWLMQNPTAWKSYQMAGRKNVEENYSAEVIGKKMASVLRNNAKFVKNNQG